MITSSEPGAGLLDFDPLALGTTPPRSAIAYWTPSPHPARRKHGSRLSPAKSDVAAATAERSSRRRGLGGRRLKEPRRGPPLTELLEVHHRIPATRRSA